MKFLAFFCQMTMESLLYAKPYQGAVVVGVGHGNKTPAFMELTLGHSQ